LNAARGHELDDSADHAGDDRQEDEPVDDAFKHGFVLCCDAPSHVPPSLLSRRTCTSLEDVSISGSDGVSNGVRQSTLCEGACFERTPKSLFNSPRKIRSRFGFGGFMRDNLYQARFRTLLASGRVLSAPHHPGAAAVLSVSYAPYVACLVGTGGEQFSAPLSFWADTWAFPFRQCQVVSPANKMMAATMTAAIQSALRFSMATPNSDMTPMYAAGTQTTNKTMKMIARILLAGIHKSALNAHKWDTEQQAPLRVGMRLGVFDVAERNHISKSWSRR